LSVGVVSPASELVTSVGVLLDTIFNMDFVV